MILRRSDRLVAGAVLGALWPAWLALVGLDALVALAGEFDELGQGGYGAATAAWYLMFTLPRRAYQLFPPAALLGCLMGLGALAASSELTALRALGLSRLRICLAALMVLSVLTLGMVTVAETLGPAGEQRAQAGVLAAKSRDVALARWSGLWARDGDTILNAREGRIEGEGALAYVVLDGVRLYEFSTDGRLSAISLAPRAEHRDGRWTLFDVRRTELLAHEARTSQQARATWTSHLDPAVLSLTAARPRYLSTRDLVAGLDYQRRNGLDTGLFESAYWARWFYPVNALVLCLAAMPFAFGPLRSGGAGKRLFLGAVLGLSYFTLQTLAVSFAEVYRIDLRLGNLLPPLLAGGGAWFAFRAGR
jgi:lipopolysaccharide export system permease protein